MSNGIAYLLKKDTSDYRSQAYASGKVQVTDAKKDRLFSSAYYYCDRKKISSFPTYLKMEKLLDIEKHYL